MIFFQFHHFALNYFPLNFVIFSLFLLFGYSESGLVKLSRIDLGFFLLNFGFFTRSSFWNFFYPDLISWVVGSSSDLKLTWVFFLDIIFFEVFFFVFIFDIRLLDLERYNFLSFFFCEFFRSHFSSHNLVNLIWIVLDYCPLNILFSIGKSLVRLAM
jgi:hypothetical protein